jgi:hypothetical protein
VGGKLSGEFQQLSLLDLIKPDLPQKTLLRPDEAATFFKVSRQTIYLWCEMGLLVSCNLNGGTLRIFRDSVISLMEKTRK